MSEQGGQGRLRLPRGRHRLSAEEVAENQRRRMIAAVAECVAANGYAATTVDRIVRTAGIARGTFYSYFDNRRDCLIAAHDAVFDRLYAEMLRACAEQDAWTAKASAAIDVLIGFAIESPNEARLIGIDPVAADPQVSRHVLGSLERLAELLRSGRKLSSHGDELPAITERALVSAAVGVIHCGLVRGASQAELAPELVHFILTPYVGSEEARRAAERPLVREAA